MGTRYIVYQKNKYTVPELKLKSAEDLEDMRQEKLRDYMRQQNNLNEFILNPDPFVPGSQEYKEQCESLKSKIRFLMLDLSTIKQIIKEKRRTTHESENKFFYRFYQAAKEILPARKLILIEEKAKETMVLKGEV